MFLHNKIHKTPKKLKKKVVYICVGVCCVFLFLYVLFQQQKRVSVNTDMPVCKDCNVLLISLDTCTAKHMQCYGYNRDTAPNLCQFGKNGILFENMYSQSNWTLPSHTSIFTGMYPFIHKMMDAYLDPMDETIPLLPEILQKNGYETYFYAPEEEITFPTSIYNRGISQWYKNYNDQSLAHAIKTMDTNNSKNKKTFIFFHSSGCHAPYLIGDNEPMYKENVIPRLPLNEKGWEELLFTEEYYQFLLLHLPEGLEKNDFHIAPEKIKQLVKDLQNAQDLSVAKKIYENAMNEDMWGEIDQIMYYSEWFRYWNMVDWTNPEHIEYLKALYDQQLLNVDKTVLAPLLNAKFLQNTIVVITADHGEEFAESRRKGHSTVYENVIKVPLVFVIPGWKHSSVQEYVQSVDITPTILDLIGIKNNYVFNGISLTSLMKGGSILNRLVIANLDYNHTAVREGDWKVLVVEDDDKNMIPYELYNTKTDPEERENILLQNMKKALDLTTKYKNLKETLLF